MLTLGTHENAGLQTAVIAAMARLVGAETPTVMKPSRRVSLPAALMIAAGALLMPMTPASAAGGSVPVPANSGTPEGTAALIKTTPKLSAGDFTLGMPKDQAVAKMKADGLLNGGVGVRSSIGFKFEQLPNHPLIGGAYGSKSDKSGGGEDVGLLFTMYPNPPVVSGISRNLRFTPDTAPNVSNTLAALRKKYGPESGTGDTNSNTIYWVFDYEGHALSKGQLAELKKAGCLLRSAGAGGGNSAMNIVSSDDMGGKISKGYHKMNNAFTSPACFSTVRIDALLKIRTPRGGNLGWGDSAWVSKAADWARVADDLVTNLLVTIKDTPLDYSASTVSRNTVLRGGEAERQRERNAAAKNKPKL